MAWKQWQRRKRPKLSHLLRPSLTDSPQVRTDSLLNSVKVRNLLCQLAARCVERNRQTLHGRTILPGTERRLACPLAERFVRVRPSHFRLCVFCAEHARVVEMIRWIAFDLKDNLLYRTLALLRHDRWRVGHCHPRVVGVLWVATPSELFFVADLDSGDPIDSATRGRFKVT